MARIVIIDDDPSIRKLARALLEAIGHSIVEADEGRSGLTAFRNFKPDLVVTDIVMPGCEGIETIREIRRMDHKTPILAMSGSGVVGQGDYLRMARLLGADANLRKPFLPQELIMMVEGLLKSEDLEKIGASVG